MGNLPTFISDLAVLLITAGIITIIFKWLKQPVVLGYIVAGFLASDNFQNIVKEIVRELTNSDKTIISFFNTLPHISDMSNVQVWADIGVIFLLFALGLEFSFKKLMAVGRTAFIATSINSGTMILVGLLVGTLLGWSQMDSLFLGGMLSMSSTIIIIKAFSDMGLQKKKFAGVVFGMLIVEDLLAILLLVMLSTLAISKHFEETEMAMSMLKLAFFILIWFVVGIYVIPSLLKKLKNYLNDETLLIVAIGLCLSMVLFATKVGFSSALGAFIMGSILAETIESKHIEQLLEPIKNLFGAIFFVSVGMMIDPNIISENIGLILLFSAIVVIGRSTFATLGVLASGEGLKVAMQTGYSLTQIGEFSFIIATLGMSLGVISNTLYPIIVAVSVITTFGTPYTIKAADPFYKWIEKRMPKKLDKLLIGYTNSSHTDIVKSNTWKKLLKGIVSIMAIYFVITLGIMLIGLKLIIPFMCDYLPTIWTSALGAVIIIVCMAPFLRAIMMRKNKSNEFKALWHSSKSNKLFLTLITLFRVACCASLIAIVLRWSLPEIYFMPRIFLSFGIVVVIIISKGFKNQSRMIEAHFLSNLNRKQNLAEKKAVLSSKNRKDLLSKDIHIEEIIISQASPSIGKTLSELNFRQITGVNIIAIIRGNKKNNIPASSDMLFPFDKIVVAGSDDQIQKLIKLVEQYQQKAEEEDINSYHVELSQYAVETDCPMIGKTIQELDIQKRTECMVIAIDRNEKTISRISGATILEAGDQLLLAGEKDKLESFEQLIKKPD